MIIWDIAGPEESFSVPMSHLRGSSGLILVADGCRRSTLDILEGLRSEAYSAANRIVPTVLAVNKVDLYDEWQITTDRLEHTGLVTFTTSAKTGKAVDLLFLHLARAMAV